MSHIAGWNIGELKVLGLCVLLSFDTMAKLQKICSCFLIFLSQGAFMLTGGFFRLPHDIPKPFWTYPMSYMAFHKYANEVLTHHTFKRTNLVIQDYLHRFDFFGGILECHEFDAHFVMFTRCFHDFRRAFIRMILWV